MPCIKISYLKPTDACQTKASSKNITGIAGIMSTIGRKAVYGSGKADNKNSISIINLTSRIKKKTIYIVYNDLV